MKNIFTLGLLLFVANAYSFTWQDLWVSADKQAKALMEKGEFAKASALFQQDSWKAAAAYRAGNYKQAAEQFAALASESGYYNQGNALAQAGDYEEALKAYDKALALNPANQDAIFNRKLVEELLKKNQDKQQNKDDKSDDKKSDSDNKDKQQGSQSDDTKDQQDNEQNEQQKQNDQQNSADKQQKDQQDKSEKDAKEKQDKDAKPNDKDEPSPKDSQQKEQEKAAKEAQNSEAQSADEREKQQAKEQWLKLIPDDPGRLMREKFLRDYIRRQRGWDQ